MKTDAFDRLALSCVVEPGDPRLVAELSFREPGELVAHIASGESQFTAEHQFRALRAKDAALRAIENSKESKLRWIVPTDLDWPNQLNDLDHVEPINSATGAPLGLWIRGDHLPSLDATVSIVGAREATAYGRDAASNFAADLAERGYVIASGAAFGIDAAAHRGALSVAGQTVAVLAGGADMDYPRAHDQLLAQIARTGGVISEQLPLATPLKNRFLSRNRIIAALGLGTLVVEAALRSGSLNTLHWADQLSRVTMGLPGPYDFRSSAGVHEAIRNGKAIMVTSPAQVAQALEPIGAPVCEPRLFHAQ